MNIVQITSLKPPANFVIVATVRVRETKTA